MRIYGNTFFSHKPEHAWIRFLKYFRLWPIHLQYGRTCFDLAISWSCYDLMRNQALALVAHSTCSVRIYLTTQFCRIKGRGGAVEKFWVDFAHSVGWVSKLEGSKLFFTCKYVAWVCKRTNNRETFKASVSSVFPGCFLVCSPIQHMLKTQSLCLESNKCFWNFPKIFLRSGRSVASSAMFPHLRRPIVSSVVSLYSKFKKKTIWA